MQQAPNLVDALWGAKNADYCGLVHTKTMINLMMQGRELDNSTFRNGQSIQGDVMMDVGLSPNEAPRYVRFQEIISVLLMKYNNASFWS